MSKWEKSDWGEIFLVSIDNGKDFWCLMEELIEEEKDKDNVTNKELFADAFRKGTMFSFEVSETESMIMRKAYNDSIFCKGTFYLLPAICIKDGDVIIILWVHKRIKKKELQKKMMKLLLEKDSFKDSPREIEIYPYIEDIYPQKTLIFQNTPQKKEGFWEKMRKLIL